MFESTFQSVLAFSNVVKMTDNKSLDIIANNACNYISNRRFARRTTPNDGEIAGAQIYIYFSMDIDHILSL